MKNLKRHKNIYIYRGRFYIDFHKDKTRIRKSTGIKKSSYALKFIRNNYDLFLSDMREARRLYRAYEDDLIYKKLINDELKIKKDNKSKLNNSEFSFQGVIDEYLKEKSFLKNSSIKSYNFFAKAILNFLDSYKIYYVSDFERQHSVDFMDYCRKNEYSAKTITSACFFLNSIFRLCIAKNLINFNPFFTPRVKNELNCDSFIPFSLDEAIKLIRNADGELKTFLILGFFTGARTGEILALTYEDLDFEKREIRINKSLSSNGIIDSPKTVSSNRIIDMLDIVYNEFLNFNNKMKKDRIITLHRYKLKILFDILQDKLGLTRRRLYDTRHTFASIMLSRGEEPMWVGCKMLGHKNLNETYKSYAKYLPKEVKQRATFLKNINLK